MNDPQRTTKAPAGDYLTIDATAARLGVKPWDVVRLIESGDLGSAVLVRHESLTEYEANR